MRKYYSKDFGQLSKVSFTCSCYAALKHIYAVYGRS